MAKFKLGSDTYGWNYNKLVEKYFTLRFSSLVSKETIHSNPDDESETEDILVLTLDSMRDFLDIKELIEACVDDDSDTYDGIRFDPPYDESDIKYEAYNDIVIVD